MQNYTVERKYISVADFCRIYGVGRTFTYRLIGTELKPGALSSTKLGSRRLISVESAEALMLEGDQS